MKANNEKLSAVCQFSDSATAEITAAMLRANGIDATVSGGVSSYPCMNYMNPVNVLVRESDLEQALKLVENGD